MYPRQKGLVLFRIMERNNVLTMDGMVTQDGVVLQVRSAQRWSAKNKLCVGFAKSLAKLESDEIYEVSTGVFVLIGKNKGVYDP